MSQKLKQLPREDSLLDHPLLLGNSFGGGAEAINIPEEETNEITFDPAQPTAEPLLLENETASLTPKLSITISPTDNFPPDPDDEDSTDYVATPSLEEVMRTFTYFPEENFLHADTDERREDTNRLSLVSDLSARLSEISNTEGNLMEPSVSFNDNVNVLTISDDDVSDADSNSTNSSGTNLSVPFRRPPREKSIFSIQRDSLLKRSLTQFEAEIERRRELTADQKIRLEEISNQTFSAGKEIVLTELTYIEALQNIFLMYLIPMKCLADVSELESLLGPCKILWHFHTTFFSDLLKCTAPVEIAELFLSQTKRFKSYKLYINRYSNLRNTIRQMAENNEELEQFLMNQPQPFEHFLLTPIQRIPRYELLLQDLVKESNVPEEKETIQQASAMIHEMNELLNRQKQNHEAFDEVGRLIAVVHGKGFDQTFWANDNRKFIYEDVTSPSNVFKRMSSMFQNRFLVFTDCLLLCDISYKIIHRYDWDTIDIAEQDDTAVKLYKKNEEKALVLNALDVKKARKWLAIFNEKIKSARQRANVGFFDSLVLGFERCSSTPL